MNGIDAGASFGDDILKGRVDFEDFVHAEHIQKDASLEGRADSHTDAALGNDWNLVLVGEAQNLRQSLPPPFVGFYPDYDVRKRPVGTVGKRVLIVDLVDGIGRDKTWADDLFKFFYDLVQSEHKTLYDLV